VLSENWYSLPALAGIAPEQIAVLHTAARATLED
jgi:hypothetical protein